MGVVKIAWILRWVVPSVALLAGCKDNEGGSNSAGTETTAGTTSAGTTSASSTSASSTDVPTTGVTGTSMDSSSEGATGEPSGDGCEQFNAGQLQVVESDCTCAVEAGWFRELAFCLEVMTEPPARAMCRCGALEPFTDADAAYQCRADGFPALLTCLEAADCEDNAARSACRAEFDEAAAACPAPSKQADGVVALQCLGDAAFMCMSGEQVPYYFTCDAEMDCPDNSDEAKELCIVTCTDGEEVPSSAYIRCDGKADCMDMSDEPPACYAECMSGEQVLKRQFCDGEINCMDASDEDGDCSFACGRGPSVPQSFVCDMEPDCLDGSDEADCP